MLQVHIVMKRKPSCGICCIKHLNTSAKKIISPLRYEHFLSLQDFVPVCCWATDDTCV